MSYRFTFARKHLPLLLPALALTLSACGDDPVEPGPGTGTETDTDAVTGTTEVDPPTTIPNPPTTETTEVDPPTSTDPDPTTETTVDPTTTPDPTTETTVDPTNETTDTSTGTTTDTSTGTSTGTDTGTSSGTDTDTDTDTDTSTGGDVFELSSVWVTANPAGLVNDAVIGLDPALANQTGKVTITGEIASIQSIAVAGSGDGYITVDLATANTGGIVIDEDMANNPPATGAIGVGERFIRGAMTGLMTPKGVEADVPGGVFLVADTAAKDMKAFDDDADGDVAPLYKITNLGGSPAVWDMHYDANDDTLFAAGIDGVVRIYDNFSVSKGGAGPTRSVTPTQGGNKISINLHGVSVQNGTLYLSDVGDANNTTDGQLFVLNNAATITGNVEVTQRIQGGKLGNPVDLEVVSVGLLGENLIVAEKSNDVLAIYNRPLLGQYTLAVEIPRTKLESVARITNNLLVLASNPTGGEMDQALVQVPAILNPPAPASVLSMLGSVTSLESVALTPDGLGRVSFDGALQSGGGGVLDISGLTDVVGDQAVTAEGIARLWGPGAGIVAPKGIAFNDGGDTLFVADFGAADVKVFDGLAVGDSDPVFTLTNLGAAPWDVAYDDVADRLFVALVNGTVLVYDDLILNQGGLAARTITPVDDQDVKLSVNLHGIEYDAAGDLLLLSDVGSAMNNADGQLFIIADASTADANVPVLAQVGGNMTKLGNPVDIAWDGVNLYVAEKANSQVLRYDNFTALTGANNIAESAARMVTNPESVALFFTLVP